MKRLLAIFVVVLISPMLIAMLLSAGGDSIATGAGVGGDVIAGQGVPGKYVAIVNRAGSICPEITPSMIASQISNESNWNANAVSPVGARGIAQFMPGTWTGSGKDGDNDGKADIDNPIDSIWSQGHLMCSLRGQIDRRLKAGTIAGNPVDLTLAAYNAGLGNVEKYGGVPSFPETQNYIKRFHDHQQNVMAYTTIGSESSSDADIPSGGYGDRVKSVIATFQRWRKVKRPLYRLGAMSASYADCTSSLSMAFMKAGLQKQKRTTYTYVHWGSFVAAKSAGSAKPPYSKMVPGDVIIFYPTMAPGYQHGGLYVGDGKMLDLGIPGQPVALSKLSARYWMTARWHVRRAPKPKTSKAPAAKPKPSKKKVKK